MVTCRHRWLRAHSLLSGEPLGLQGQQTLFLQSALCAAGKQRQARLFSGMIYRGNELQKHQFFSAQLSLWSNSHIHT